MDREAGVLRFMGSQRVRHDWATELNWTERWRAGLPYSKTHTIYLSSYVYDKNFLSSQETLQVWNRLKGAVKKEVTNLREKWKEEQVLKQSGFETAPKEQKKAWHANLKVSEHMLQGIWVMKTIE